MLTSLSASVCFAPSLSPRPSPSADTSLCLRQPLTLLLHSRISLSTPTRTLSHSTSSLAMAPTSTRITSSSIALLAPKLTWVTCISTCSAPLFWLTLRPPPYLIPAPCLVVFPSILRTRLSQPRHSAPALPSNSCSPVPPPHQQPLFPASSQSWWSMSTGLVNGVKVSRESLLLSFGDRLTVLADDPNKVVTVTHSLERPPGSHDSYTSCKVVGNGSFGVVFAAKMLGTSVTVLWL